MNKDMKKFCDKKKEQPDYYETIKKYQIDMSPFSVLLGPNGTGKTMSLMSIEQECKDMGLQVFRFNTAMFNPVNDMHFRPERIITAFHSEGEHLKESIEFWFGDHVIPALLNNDEDIYIFVDQIDSGMSIDKMKSFMNDMLYIYHAECKKHPNRRIRFIFTANSYEFVDFFKDDHLFTMFWVPTRSFIRIKSYENFKNRYLEYYDYMRETEDEQ